MKAPEFIQGDVKTPIVKSDDEIMMAINVIAGPDNEPDIIIPDDLPKESLHWFFDEIYNTITSLPGCSERDQISFLLNTTRKVRIAQDLFFNIRNDIQDDKKLEQAYRYLDYIEFPNQALWIECNNIDGEVTDIGYLISPSPSGPGHQIGFVAWKQNDGQIFHSYAIMHWNMNDFFMDIINENDVREKLMNKVKVTIPDGFSRELEIMNDIRSCNDPKIKRMNDYNMSVVLRENIFIIYAMLVLSCKNIIFDEDNNFSAQDRWIAHALRYPRVVKFIRSLYKEKGFQVNESSLYYEV